MRKPWGEAHVTAGTTWQPSGDTILEMDGPALVDPPQLTSPRGEEMSCHCQAPPKVHIYKQNNCHRSGPLSFGVVCYTAIDKRDRRQGQIIKVVLKVNL